MYTVVYMAVVNDIISVVPMEEKNGYTVHLKRRRFLHDVKDHNKPIKKHITKECHNCSHYLSKYYYWRQSPCELCSRSPAFYYRLSKSSLLDNWDPITRSQVTRKNILYH